MTFLIIKKISGFLFLDRFLLLSYNYLLYIFKINIINNYKKIGNLYRNLENKHNIFLIFRNVVGGGEAMADFGGYPPGARGHPAGGPATASPVAVATKTSRNSWPTASPVKEVSSVDCQPLGWALQGRRKLKLRPQSTVEETSMTGR